MKHKVIIYYKIFKKVKIYLAQKNKKMSFQRLFRSLIEKKYQIKISELNYIPGIESKYYIVYS